MQSPADNQKSEATRAIEQQVFGENLRIMRHAAQYTAEMLAQTTRINLAFIEALEAGNLAALPGAIFARGFIRNIAKQLNADPTHLLAEFERLWPSGVPSSVLKVEIKNAPVKRPSDARLRFAVNMRSLARSGFGLRVALPLALTAVVIGSFAIPSAIRVASRFSRLARFATKSSILAQGPVADLAGNKEVAKEVAKVLTISATEAPSANKVSTATAEVAPETPRLATETPDVQTQTRASSTGKSTPIEIAMNDLSTHKDATAKGTAGDVGAVGNPGVLELTVTEPLRVKFDLGHGQIATKELKPDVYSLTFPARADLMIYDAAAVKISFNGKPLGPLGAKGRIRRLSFQMPLPDDNKN